MRKKYLIKQPSQQVFQHLQCSSILNHTQQPDHKSRGSHNRPTRPIQQRLKTQPTNQVYEPQRPKRQGSVGSLKKARYYIPGNKENHKLQKSGSGNRFTYNQYRGSEFLDMEKGKLDTTIENNNRYSESKHLQKRSLQKLNKFQKYKLSSPKNFNKMRPTDDSAQLSNLKSFIHRAQKQASKDAIEEVLRSPLRLQDLVLEQQIGSGTFGKVYSGKVKNSGVRVAVKRVQQDKKYKTRELQIVKMLDSPFIVKLLGTFVTDEGRHQYLNIVMQTFQQNFFQLLKTNPSLTTLDLKCYTYQMIRGLLYLHSQGVCHRDLKPQNMLVKQKKLVVCDFGSAKILKPGEQNISYICSRCYRAPQLIFQSTNYTTQIDMWSLGCIFLQILNGRPLFIADSSLNHILEVIKTLGTPTKDDVRSMNPSYEINDYDLPQIKRRPFKSLFPGADPLFLDLTDKLVRYAPDKRPSAGQALAHPYFDQLREERHFKVNGRFKGCEHFFDFSKENLSSSLRQKLVPKWLRSSY